MTLLFSCIGRSHKAWSHWRVRLETEEIPQRTERASPDETGSVKLCVAINPIVGIVLVE